MEAGYLTFCTVCGYKLGRSREGTESEVICPRCGALVCYAVKEDAVTVRMLKPSPKKPPK